MQDRCDLAARMMRRIRSVAGATRWYGVGSGCPRNVVKGVLMLIQHGRLLHALKAHMSPAFAVLAILLLIAAPARGGERFDQLPGVGPVNTWEHPGTFAFLARIDRLIDQRISEVPLTRNRTVYVRQSDTGSPDGGGGDGRSPATAFRARHMNDVRAIAIAQLQPNTALLFRQGDTFYAEPVNTMQGIPMMAFGNYTIGTYFDLAAPSLDKPRLLGFAPPFGAQGWTTRGDGAAERSISFDIYWVRGRTVGSDPIRGFRNVPYVRAAASSDVASLERSFVLANGRLIVRPGPVSGPAPADDLSFIEATVAQGGAIAVGNVDGVRIDNLILEGWGTNEPSGGATAIFFGGGSTNRLLVTRCEWGWTAYHGMLHANSDPTGGGIVTLHQCTFGYHINRSFAEGFGGDGAVSFALNGRNEFYVSECVGFGGGLARLGLPGADSNLQGMPMYMHSGGQIPIGMHVRRGCVFAPLHPTRTRYSDHAMAGDAVVDAAGNITPLPANPGDKRYYRAFIVDERIEIDGGPLAGASRGVEINSRILRRVGAGTGMRYLWGSAGSTHHALIINRDLEIRLDPGYTGYFFMGEANSNHNHRWHHVRTRTTIGGPGLPQDFFAGEASAARLLTCSLWNCVFSEETPAELARLRYPNQVPGDDAGGMWHSAFFGFRSEHYNQTAAPITLTAPASFPADDASRALIPQSMRRAGAPGGEGGPDDPTPIVIEYDITRAARSRSAPTPGPLEYDPIICRADFNTDRTADFFDYLDFVADFAVGTRRADFDFSGDVDFFDYLDFVAEFSNGCD
jgi:hypothetical protein